MFACIKGKDPRNVVRCYDIGKPSESCSQGLVYSIHPLLEPCFLSIYVCICVCVCMCVCVCECAYVSAQC